MPVLSTQHQFRRLPVKWSGLTFFLPALLVVMAVLVGLALIDADQRTRHKAAERSMAVEQLVKVASRLETDIRGNVNLVHGLVAAVAGDPSLSQKRFTALSERLLAVPSQLRNLAAAPDFVIRYIYPEEGNEKSIGLDYTKNLDQRDAALKSLERRKVIITGPVDLVQGGQGLIARYPVFSLGQGRFWGILSAVIDVDRLYRDSNLMSQEQALDIAIARRTVPFEGDVFFGDAKVFDQEPVRTTIDFGYETWYFAAVPKSGWTSQPSQLSSFRIYALVAALCIVTPLIWAGFLMKQRQRNIRLLQEREERLETLSQRLELALQVSNIGVWEYDPATDRLILDRRMCELYGFSPDQAECRYSAWKNVLHPADGIATEEAFASTLRDGTSFLRDFRVILPTGEVRHIRSHGALHRTSAGGERVIGANWDVSADVILQTELREARAETEEQNRQLRSTRRILEHQSLHDALTGLPNRRYLDQFMVNADTTDLSQKLAFIHIDLDLFKQVNDTLGHATGDEVLKAATARLLEIVGPEEVVSRIGGDEFVIVTCGFDPKARASALAQAVVTSLARPIHVGGQECRIGCSAGIACQKTASETPAQLLINADIALYEAKKRGRNRVEFFSEELRAAAVKTKRVADELLKALETDQFIPFFQPQFEARTLAITGVEALARWDHPSRGILTPDKFLGVAEGLGRVAEIDAIILEKALFQTTRWRSQELAIPKLSVNISAQRLKDEGLSATLSKLPLTPGALSFELLESISFDEEDESLVAAIQELKALGIDIEIDDFGSGHASIISLLELAPKRLKIDRKLVAPLDASVSQRRLVASIIEIGRSQGIEIVAEGVETMVHAEILRDLGCHALQGYAFARPMGAADFMTFAREWQAVHPSSGADLTPLRKI